MVIVLEKRVDRFDRKIDKSRMKRKMSEDLETVQAVVDKRTAMILYGLINRGYLTSMKGVVSSGKEANVYWATVEKEGEIRDLAVKIFRTSTMDFKRIWIYIQGDPRFSRVKRDTRSIVYTWAEKEFKNLSLADEVGVRVPKPVVCRGNVLVMEFIGEEGVPAPRLKEAVIEEPDSVFEIVLDYVVKLYRGAELVHADLSEYNILYWDEPVIIDVSQAVLLSHPQAIEFLVRDIRNVLRYFSSLGVNVLSLDEAYRKVTGEELAWRPESL
ncbi:MAG: serine protein kinase RIO [Candidatus Jordarchaeum sp.]|uniref:serine protein kinase RIO n=1 Tax=Candidatus Jordarchaeum sp. TaxID=2823881 RepID=UPI00404A9F70